jgi:hypothetical protein
MGTGARGVGMKTIKQLNFSSSWLEQVHEIICTEKLCHHALILTVVTLPDIV